MTPPPAPEPSGVATVAERVIATVLGLYVAVVAGVRLVLAPFDHRLWADRDLSRAARLLEDLPTTGAELSYGSGARIPGGAGHVLLAVAQLVQDDPLGVQRVLYLLDTVGMGFVACLAWRRAGPLAGAATAAVWIGAHAGDEGLAQLWNPAYLPLFVAVSVVGLHQFVLTRRARWLALWGLGVALAAHMHLSALVWGGAGVVVLVFSEDRRGLLRALPAAFAAGLATYVPHIVDELVHGFPNTREMLVQPHLRAVTGDPIRKWRLEDLDTVLGYVSGHGPVSALPGWLAPVVYVSLVAFVAGLVAPLIRVRRGEAEARGLLVVGATTTVAVAYLLLDPLIATQERYFHVVVPGVALTAGVGLVALAGLARRGGEKLGVAAQVALALAVALPASWWFDAPRDPGGEWAYDQQAYDMVRAETGWTWRELSGRLVFAVSGEDGVRWSAHKGADDLLRRNGTAFDGSLPPPCALVVNGLRPGELDEAMVRSIVHVGEGGLRVDEVVELSAALSLAIFDPGTPLCPTSLVQRYVDRPAEAAVRAVMDALPEGRAGRLPDPAPGVTRYAVAVQSDPTWEGARMGIAVDLRREGDRLHVTLESNQLRGEALNLGWYLSAMVDRPRLRLEPLDGGPTQEVVIVDGLVGYKAALPPVRTTTALVGSGPWRVVLVLDRVHGVEGAAWPMPTMETTPAEIVLSERWPEGPEVVAR